MGAHKRRKYVFLHCPPPPKLSHHAGNIIGYGPSLCLPCLLRPYSTCPTLDQPQSLLQGCFPRSPAPTSQSVPHSQVGRTTEFLGWKAILLSWIVIPKRTYYLFSTKQTWSQAFGQQVTWPCKGGSSLPPTPICPSLTQKMWPDP